MTKRSKKPRDFNAMAQAIVDEARKSSEPGRRKRNKAKSPRPVSKKRKS